MTTLLGTQDIARIVAAHGLPEVLRRMEAAIAADFRRWPEFDKVARLASHSADGVIELMPAADATHYAFKYVNGHPRNTAAGLPTVMAFGVLADVATGMPTLLSELTITTAIRTAATSALAARALARPGSRTMALIGNGAQSEFQALAFHHLLGITTLRLYDTDATATAKLMRHLRAVPGLRLIACAGTAEAVRGADIVTTVTADKRRAVIIEPAMIEPGMHLNAVGGDCPGKTELHPGVLQAASVFVEYEAQSRVEGEIQQMAPGFKVTELWRVLTGQAQGRRSETEVTVFDSVGFALEDFSALRLLAELAAELGLGQELPLIPALADPKDLFSQLAVSTPRLRAA
ncbi:Ornithine cyclodeaminase [Rubrivivax sp. A210]|uniref:ornithine cyclodeaminase n=1 Tax=Rubrivivax sp. A210 TaxID=2772301 RepID=UPI001917AD77|nr:ornithine cyclodeaminase [Rubrivivax sp. A210]CAD5370251.1 Ornithine cyclodeaminase [Rubrivivax sp. A210]